MVNFVALIPLIDALGSLVLRLIEMARQSGDLSQEQLEKLRADAEVISRKVAELPVRDV